jgi:N-hydroxyarylamine O-acetyltransferase
VTTARAGGLFLGSHDPGKLDLDAYSVRIGYSGPRVPRLAVLEEILRLQAGAIPFEAIDPFLGRPVDLSPAAIETKLLHGGRGGYCFEQNTLLLRALRALGFRVEPLIARSRWQRPLDQFAVRTHMVLRVDVDGIAWIADLGFGSCMFTSPLRADLSGVPQETRHEPIRILEIDGELRLERLLDGVWTPLYDLVKEPQTMVEMAAANWLISSHPDSTFRTRLVASCTRDEVRHVLSDRKLVVRHRDGRVERRDLSIAQVVESLSTDFGLDVPAQLPAELEARWTLEDNATA